MPSVPLRCVHTERSPDPPPVVNAAGAWAFPDRGRFISLRRWSRQINREIRDALAKANALATEAFTNVRTVRAFSTEAKEVVGYQSATAEALAKGIKDAVAGAGTYAFTNYVDLGAGVLVLWYGGNVVMRHEGLSMGDLITFQLYWTMLNSAWKGLNDVINSFTRAAVRSCILPDPPPPPRANLHLE